MTDKERLLKKIQLKSGSGLSIVPEISEAADMAFNELLDKADVFTGMDDLADRFEDDMEKLPDVTSAVGRISVKLDLVDECFERFLESYKNSSYMEWKKDVDYLNILGFSLVRDTEDICDLENMDVDLEELSGMKLDRDNADIEMYIELFPSYLKACKDKLTGSGKELYTEINNLMFLTDYGTEAAYNFKDNK